MEIIIAGIISIAILAFSAILHEIAHGFLADRLGDPTARLAGRLTLDPRPHIDPLFTIVLPLILFFTSPIIIGGAKPVPIDPFNFRDGRKDVALVSMVGPLTNLILAIIGAILIHLLYQGAPLHVVGNDLYLGFILAQFVQLNLLLAIFNLIPVPPLDGSKVLALLLPEKLANAFLSLGSVGFFIIFFLLLSSGPLSLGGLVSSLLFFSEKILGF
jgi:Zn-dependent protease